MTRSSASRMRSRDGSIRSSLAVGHSAEIDETDAPSRPRQRLQLVGARELAQATLGMIGGQYLDVTDTAPDRQTLDRLKTGRLFDASVACALWVAEVPEREQAPWRAFGGELGLLFQAVDDILDGDGFVLSHGVEGARAVADEAAARAHARLEAIPADTSVLAEIVSGLVTRTA